MQTWCAQPYCPVLPQYMQMKGSGPLHCAAVMHRSAAACAGTPISALAARTAANNSDVFDNVLIMISPSDLHGEFVASGLRKLGAGNRLGSQCPAIKGYKSIGFKRVVVKIHIDSARHALSEKLARDAPAQFAAVVSGRRAACAARAVSASAARRFCASSPPGWMMPADMMSCIACSTVMSRSITSRRGT